MAVTRVSIFKFEALVYQSLDRFLVSVADPGSGIQCFFVAWIPRIRIRELGWKKSGSGFPVSGTLITIFPP
jgi:hypothetical protein